ncbi:MAG: septum formation inhibitor Maf [Verrucomicrobia bacterium]|nr:MAG: septum formation inhibitor Maf [Verrucomicrobiota bacterium]
MAAVESRIYLASRSPRRRDLLAQIGVRFDVLQFRADPRSDVEVDESPHAGETPEVYVVRVARAKAAFAARLLESRHLLPRPILAADTTLDLDGEIIGKPRSENDAQKILARLSGRKHRVLTAIAVTDQIHLEHRLHISDVTFRQIDADEIRRYVLSGEAMDKAGAYAIQGRAAAFVEEIRGSHSGIVGLPLCETAQLLKQFGWTP